MARPRKTTRLTSLEAGVIAYVTYGWLTVAEATLALGCHRRTLERWLVVLGVDARSARIRYVSRLIAKAEGRGFRPLTKAQLRERGVRAVVDYEPLSSGAGPPANRHKIALRDLA